MFVFQALGTVWTHEENPTQVEEDLWEDSMLNVIVVTRHEYLSLSNTHTQAYSHLTKWKDLEKAATKNISEQVPPSLDQLWEDSYYQVLFSLCLSFTVSFSLLNRNTICHLSYHQS